MSRFCPLLAASIGIETESLQYLPIQYVLKTAANKHGILVLLRAISGRYNGTSDQLTVY